METPLIDFAPKAVATIVKCQEILAEYIVPDSGISDHECINSLLGVLDDQALVKEMRQIDLAASKKFALIKEWPASKNVKTTAYHIGSHTLQIECVNGNIYQYFDVPENIWEELIASNHIGMFWAEKIKGFFRYCHINGD